MAAEFERTDDVEAFIRKCERSRVAFAGEEGADDAIAAVLAGDD